MRERERGGGGNEKERERERGGRWGRKNNEKNTNLFYSH